MPFPHAPTTRLAMLVLATACVGLYAAGGAAAKQDPAAPYLGMSQAEVIACAGEPHSRFESGSNKETLTYHYSGAGPVPAEKSKVDDDKSDDKKSDDKKSGIKKSADKKSDDKKSDKNKLSSLFGKNKKKADKDWTCSASLVFENGKLARVSFSHKDVHSPYDWQAEKDPKKQEQMRQAGVPSCEFSLPRCAR